CPADGSCVAIGSYLDTAGLYEGVIETLSAGIWTPTEAPRPSNFNSTEGLDLFALSCPAVESCVATGFSAAGGKSLFETLSAGAWTATVAPVPVDANANPQDGIGSLSCPAVGSCVALGTYFDTSDAVQGMFVTLSGGSWTSVQEPKPPNFTGWTGVTPATVTCPAVGACVAMGSYSATSLSEVSFFETLSGGTWTPTTAPLPANSNDAIVTSLSCPSVSSCVAVGYVDVASPGTQLGLIETLSAGTWVPSTAPLPGTTSSPPYSNLTIVTCPTSGSCVATGWFTDSNNIQQGVLETLSGGTWSPATAPVPADATTWGATLSAVACPAANSCVVAGTYYDSSNNYQGLIETQANSTAPTITSVAPNTGPTSGGTGVTIIGTNLASPTSVTFGGSPGTVTASTDTSITVTTPPGVAGLVDVVVETAGGIA